jgi:hypothetical protein
MADVLLVYSPFDAAAVQPIRTALEHEGFDVAQLDEPEPGKDYAEYIERTVSKARCVVAIWSKDALLSFDVKKAARFALVAEKLVPVLITDLAARRASSELVTPDSARLAGWAGDTEAPEWGRFLHAVESKIPSIWTLRRWGARDRELQDELRAERSQREAAEARVLALEARLAQGGMPAAAAPAPATTGTIPTAPAPSSLSEQVFISYASADRALVKPLAERLEREGFSVWWDTQLLGGEQYRKTIIEKLATAKAAIVVWTAASIESDWVYDEATRARRGGRLIPLRGADLDPDLIPPPFGALHSLDCTDMRAIMLSLLRLGVTPMKTVVLP